MNPLINTCETTMSNVHIGSTELLDSDAMGLELPATTMDSGLTNSMFSMLMSHEMLTPYKQKGELESMPDHLNLPQYSMPSNDAEQPQFMYAGLGEEKMTFLNKRKATAEVQDCNPNLSNMSFSNKRVALSGSPPKTSWLPQLAAQNKRARTTVLRKKREHVEPIMSKSTLAVSRNQITQSKVSSTLETKKIDSMRTKLRESLSAALALVSEQKESSLSTEKTEDMTEVPTQKGEFNPPTSVSTNVNCSSNKFSDPQESRLEEISVEAWKFLGPDFQSNPIFPGDDAPFGESLFLRDELLQGNGLSWAMDFDAQIAEMRAVDSAQGDELSHEADVQEKEQADLSPESVAHRIESELFTLFGGVNKKYKEKGRSLLFNLKDHNNPELRERVVSGEISPERLCAMTAEELASKELSQWRMAKAEELDHMKVLPDSEVNMRRLVKKTHKGEYQVDFDQDISVVEDIPTNLSVVRENGKKKKSDSDSTITIPGDGTEMLGLMVDDMRDLPPILSLDEFMESLDKEPPFENLAIDSGRTPELDNIIVEDDAESKSPTLLASKKHENDSVVSSLSNSKKYEKDSVVSSLSTFKKDEKSVKSGGHVNSAEIQRASATTIVAEQVKVEYLWEGLLQLTLSTTAYVVAIYKSGEKASTRGWPSSFEIKGRVRLDAFDKFLQELPKSRTRATMVVHFALAKRCTEDERCNLIDLIDSYVTDQRLGYAEPSLGVELYMCPPRSKTVDMIIKHLPKGYTEKLADIDNGLIGILVWRKEKLPSVTLPNPPMQHKHTTPDEHSSFSRQLPNKDVNRSVSFASRVVPPPKSCDDDADDAPPGFGPPGVDQEDDDLPEFNFSAGPTSSTFPTAKPHNPPPLVPLRSEVPSQQLEQMRALIQKYGKSGDSNSVNGIPVQPWNDDDDDDIPEWQPQTIHSQQPCAPPGFPAQNPNMISRVPSRPPFQQPVVPVAKPMPSVYPSIRAQGTWRHPGSNTVQPSGSPRTGRQSRGGLFRGHYNRGGRSGNDFRSRGI